MDRRSFIQQSTALAGGLLAFPSFYIPKRPKLSQTVIGHGDYRYRIHREWGQLDPAKTPVNDCHEMVMDKRGRLIMLTNEIRNNIIVYDKSGKLLESWGSSFPGGHGLTLHDEGGEEFLYITDISLGKVFKTTLSGRILLTIDHPKTVGAYGDCDKFSPTETTIGPNGDIYIADGYGSQFILQYNAKGQFIRKFGGDSYREDKFKQAHGVTLDTRDKNNPTLLCTSRMHNAFKRFSLDGQYISTIHLPGAFVSRAVVDGENIYSGVCFSSLKYYNLTYNSGFVTILDGQNRIVSNPGGTKPVYKKGELQLMMQDSPIFIHCHDVCVDEDKNLYVCQWNANKTYPIKLERV